MSLTPGANAAVPAGPLSLSLHYTPVPGVDLDVSAFLLHANGRVSGDADMCFYGQTNVSGGAVQLAVAESGRAVFSLALDRLDSSVEKVAITATLHENRARFAEVQALRFTLTGGIESRIFTDGMQETALIVAEFYKRNGIWKVRCVAQGFAGGLEPLARHFGVDVAGPATGSNAPSQAPAPAPSPKINLSKISLDKARPSISLDKAGGQFGEIRVNLNWNRASSQGASRGGFLGGLLGGGRSNGGGIDLDVGCLFELRDGQKGAVQALGNSFGNYVYPPHIELLGDDRTGASADGEWLRINGDHWSEIRRVLVYAFIYDGAPHWAATDGVVTVHVPGQPPIEVRLNEEGGQHGMCAIALLENVGGSVQVTREVKFFRGHRFMDEHFRWGLNWVAGSK